MEETYFTHEWHFRGKLHPSLRVHLVGCSSIPFIEALIWIAMTLSLDSIGLAAITSVIVVLVPQTMGRFDRLPFPEHPAFL